MPLAIEYIIVIVLAAILLLLLLIFAVAVCVFTKKRRILCFKKDLAAQPFLVTDQQLEAGLKGKQRQRGKAFSHARRPKPGGNKRKGKGDKSSNYRYEPLQSPRKKDPFANGILDNPLVDEEEFNVDWSNPTFDSERSRRYDAAVIIQTWFRMIRVRIPYLQLREATIFCQSLYRGCKVRRMLPQLKKEKQIRNQKRKKQAGWKKKGTLSALKFYEVKGYGFAEVEQLYGLETIRNAADQLKKLYGGKGKMRLKIFISVKGIKLFDHFTMSHFATVKVSSVSFCTLDPKSKKLFAFINRKKKRNFCHVFQANEQDAQKMVETMAEAFEVTFKQTEERREQREMAREARLKNARLARLQKKAFHRQSQELEVELASMMEMAETASVNTPRLDHSQKMLHIAEVHYSSGGSSPEPEGSPVSGSRELLIPGHQSKSGTKGESNLLVSHSADGAPSRRRVDKGREPDEAFDPNEVDSYFTDIKRGMEDMAHALETDSKRASVEAEQRRQKLKQRTDNR